MAVYFDSFRTEYAPQKVLSRIKSITYNISGIQDDDSIMCGFFWIAFIECTLEWKILINCTNQFSPSDKRMAR